MPNNNAAYTVEFGIKFPAIFLRFYIFLNEYLIKWHLPYIKIIRKIQGILLHKNHSSLLNIKENYTRMMSNPSPETPPPSFIHWITWMKPRGAVHIWVLGPKLMNLAIEQQKQKKTLIIKLQYYKQSWSLFLTLTGTVHKLFPMNYVR